MRDNYLYRVAKSLPLMRKTFIEACCGPTSRPPGFRSLPLMRKTFIEACPRLSGSWK